MSEIHHVVDVDRACRELNAMHERVTRHWGRIEITRAGAADPCDVAVLVSKVELDSIERALAILCELPGGQSVCKQLTNLARDCMEEVRDGNPSFAAAAESLYAKASDDSIADGAAI